MENTSIAIKKFQLGQSKTKKSILVEMKLVVLLLGFPLVLCYQQTYQGFDRCGVNGWYCSHVDGQYEITYDCSQGQSGARVWVWTARFPLGSRIFTVRNCENLEVHLDCTKGSRESLLNKFQVINVKNLYFLPPLLPSIFLHDNDQIPQAPNHMHIENVQNVEFFPGLFDKPDGKCKYKSIELISLTFKKVIMKTLMKGAFYNQNLDKIVMEDVIVKSIDTNAINVKANASFSGTTFPTLPTLAITIKGENITFRNNSFNKIQSSALTIGCRKFEFSNNSVAEIDGQGLDVLGAEIDITNNKINHLETAALQKITPSFSPLSYQIAFRFKYNFSNNFVKNINPGSLHLNWEVHSKICSDLIFENNVFECSCMNLGWISVSSGLGTVITKAKEFYDTYLHEGGNTCYGYNKCSLSSVVTRIQDVCNNKTNVSTICEAQEKYVADDTATLPEDWQPAVMSSTEEANENTKEQIASHSELTEVSEKHMPLLSYTENQTSYLENKNVPVWIVVVSLIIALAAICTGMFLWWYKKKKQRQAITTVYKNEKGADTDNLILNI